MYFRHADTVVRKTEDQAIHYILKVLSIIAWLSWSRHKTLKSSFPFFRRNYFLVFLKKWHILKTIFKFIHLSL